MIRSEVVMKVERTRVIVGTTRNEASTIVNITMPNRQQVSEKYVFTKYKIAPPRYVCI